MEKLKVFISYATEDREAVESAYNELKNNGYLPWMDCKNILPGEKWETSIWTAVKQSDIFLLFVSENSFNKRGFLQKEIKTALSIWEEKLEDDIYIIPVRLSDCKVPEILSSFQYCNYFDGDFWQKLNSSLNLMADKLGKLGSANSTQYSITTKTIEEASDDTISYTMKLEYPILEGESNLIEINSVIEGFITNQLQEQRKHIIEMREESELVEIYGESHWVDNFQISYSSPYISENIFSVEFTIYNYALGMAHGNWIHKTFCFSVNPTFEIKLEDLFDSNTDYLEFISSYCIKELLKPLGFEIHTRESKEFVESFLKDGVSPKLENFRNFLFNDNEMTIMFHPYQAGCFAEGSKSVKIPLEILIKYFRINTELSEVILRNV